MLGNGACESPLGQKCCLNHRGGVGTTWCTSWCGAYLGWVPLGAGSADLEKPGVLEVQGRLMKSSSGTCCHHVTPDLLYDFKPASGPPTMSNLWLGLLRATALENGSAVMDSHLTCLFLLGTDQGTGRCSGTAAGSEELWGLRWHSHSALVNYLQGVQLQGVGSPIPSCLWGTFLPRVF